MWRVSLLRCIWVSLAVIFAHGMTFGQTGSGSSTGYTLHVLTDLIEVPVLALRPPFRPALSLKLNDFRIRLDGGNEFRPRNARVEGMEPLRLIVLINEDSKTANLLSRGLLDGVNAWPKGTFTSGDHVSILHSACGSLLPPSPANSFGTSTKNAFTSALDSDRLLKSPSCQTFGMERPLRSALEQFRQSRMWNILLVLVNGEHYETPALLAELQTIAAANRVAIFAIKYLPEGSFPASVYSETEGLNTLTASTGGLTLATSFADLRSVMQQVLTDVRSRYILSFPRPGNESAGTHIIEVKAAVKGVRILSSSAAAPLTDKELCTTGSLVNTCSEDRPQYGPDRPLTGHP